MLSKTSTLFDDFSATRDVIKITAPGSAKATISQDLLAAISAAFICTKEPFDAFYEKKLKSREKELVERVLNSRYPYATLYTPEEDDMRKFLCFYGILLSDSKQDVLMVLKKIDKVYKLELAGIMFDQSNSDRHNPHLPVNGAIYDFACVVAALARKISGHDLVTEDSFKNKRDIFESFLACSSNLYGIDLNEIMFNGSFDQKLAEKAVAKIKNHTYALFHEKLCCMFCNYFGLTEEPDFPFGVFESSLQDMLSELKESIKNFFIMIKGNNSDQLSASEFILYINLISCLSGNLAFASETRASVIDEILHGAADADTEPEEPAEELVPISQLNQLLDEKAALEKRFSALQEERDILSGKINELRSDLANAKADNRFYKEQLESIQQNNDLDEDMDCSLECEPLSDEEFQLLRDLKVVIFGGRDRLHQHMEQDHMGWTYIKAKENFSKNQIDSADLIIVVSKYVSHASYFKVCSYAENNPDLKKRIIRTPYENKDLIYHQAINWLAS